MEKRMIRPWYVLLILAVSIIAVGFIFWIAVFGYSGVAVLTYIAFLAIVAAILLKGIGLSRLEVKVQKD